MKPYYEHSGTALDPEAIARRIWMEMHAAGTLGGLCSDDILRVLIAYFTLTAIRSRGVAREGKK